MGTEGVQRKSVCYARSGGTARAEKVTLAAPANTVGYLLVGREGAWHINSVEDRGSGQKILVVT